MSAPLNLDTVPLPWQQDAWDTLTARMMSAQLAHGLLISGQAGTGKGLFASALARLALCRQPRDGRACGTCSGCAQFNAASHPDFQRVTFEEREGKAGEEGALKQNISVEQIRDLIAGLQLHSHQGGRKVAVVEPAEGMSIAASNSLLKTLEEPPAETLILLVSSAAGRLPATIRSRCQLVAMPTPKTTQALSWLQARETRDDWAVLLALAGGAPLAAMELAASDLGSRRKAFFEGLLRLRAGQANPVMLATQPKERYPELLQLLWSFTSDLILVRNGGGARVMNRDQLPLLQKAAEGIHLRSLYAFLDRIQSALQALDTSANRELTFAVLLSDWAGGLDDIKGSPLAANEWGNR
ncbi:MAG TPA: DNA polymerase III subunit delta' [Gammaproteobacteria bacterium]|jgi:DNA polymerase-3 subunit delta'